MAYTKKTRVTSAPRKTNENGIATNLDPDKHYILVHKDGQDAEEDMAAWQGLNYQPARGNETLKSAPFATPENNPNGLKVRGNRILMCCPMSEYKKRKQANTIRNKERAGMLKRDKANETERRKIVRETGIEPDSVTVDDVVESGTFK